MKKIMSIFKEMWKIILKHKLYFLAPLIIAIVFFNVLLVKFGPNVISAFIHAGV